MDVFVCGTRYPYHVFIHTIPYLSAMHRESLCFSFLLNITRQLHHFSLKLLFLHLPICHLLFFALSWTFLPICLPLASVTVMCSLYGSITFLAYLFDLWIWVWNCIWLHEVDKSHLKVQVCETWSYLCTGCSGFDLCTWCSDLLHCCGIGFHAVVVCEVITCQVNTSKIKDAYFSSYLSCCSPGPQQYIVYLGCQ